MKPFNLEEFKAGAIGITRGGEEVTFVAHVPNAEEAYRVVFLEDDGCVDACAEDGRYNPGRDSESDLIGLKPETLIVWLNLYPEANLTYKRAYGYASREAAEEGAGGCRINGKSYRVEIELC